MTEITVPGASEMIARDVNSRGEVVGEYRDARGSHGFLLDATGLRDLSVSSPGFVPRAISDQGVMVGTLDMVVNGAPVTHAAVRDAAGPVRDLGTLGGGNSVALDVNSAGQVVGSSETAGGTQLAFLSSGSGMTQIGPAGGFLVSATSINEQGQVVGSDNRGDFGRSEAFLYANGATTLLAQDSGSQGAFASGINAAGVMSGWIDHYSAPRSPARRFAGRAGCPRSSGRSAAAARSTATATSSARTPSRSEIVSALRSSGKDR